MVAVHSALVVIGYFGLPEEDQPPEEIWHHEERLEEWFRAVKQNREARLKGMEPITEGTLEKNELTDKLLGRG